jgi:hypothetical protein
MIGPVNTRAWPILCVLAAAGCKTTEPMTEEKFCQEYARIECGKIADLCTFNPASCEPIRVEACRMAAARLKGGGHQFNPDNTDECLNTLEGAFKNLPIKADKLQEIDDACARVFAGVAKVTDPCTIDYDCAKGLICDKGHCGTLKVVPSRGGCANIGERCQPEEYCTNENPNMLYMCMPRLVEGSACSPSRPCTTGLRCRDTCVRKLPIAGACTDNEDCETGYCTEFVPNPTCGIGLNFATGSPSCLAFMGVPVRGPNEVADAGTD